MKSEKIEIVFYKDNKGFKVPLQTKSEVIEKMAKAMYEHQYQKTRPFWEDDDNGYREIYLKRAEAALNALLEDNKHEG